MKIISALVWYAIMTAALFAFFLIIPILDALKQSSLQIGVAQTYGVLLFMALCLLVSGVSLYVMRRSHRLLYGVIEIVGAVVLVWVTFFRAFQTASLDDELKLAAAIYVFVRGMDNIGEGLSAKRKAVWDRYFPKAVP
jgi:uncharacterized membrane protein YhaH (DUF805 family)